MNVASFIVFQEWTAKKSQKCCGLVVCLPFSYLVNMGVLYIVSVPHISCSNFRRLAIKQPSTMAVWILVNVLLYRKNGAKMKSI